MQVEVIKRSRLNGRDVEAGEVVELDAALAAAWFRGGRARQMSIPGKPPKVEIQLKALDAYSLEELGELTRKNLLELAKINGVEAPKKAGKQELIDLLMDAKASEGPPEEKPEEKPEKKPEEPKAIGPYSREDLGDLTRKNLLGLARTKGIETTRKTGKQQLIDLLMKAKEDEGEGKSDEETEGKPEETGESEGENPASSD